MTSDSHVRAPAAQASAHGRVNLLGEHTDYNDGFVLPAAIPQRTTVSLRSISGPASRVYSQNLDRGCALEPGSAPSLQVARYVHGCLEEVRMRFGSVPPLDIHIASDVPMGVGLSSSAALEIATLRALRELLRLPLDDVALALMAQKVEIDHAGVHCGILDQMACSLLSPGGMLYLDTRTLQRERLPLPEGSELLVVDSGLSRELAGSAYNERRAQCEQAARLLGVDALRDVADASALRGLPPLLRRRARHVVSENERVQQARLADAATFGRLMRASHASLSQDYEVSTPELDRLVELLVADAEVYGAKLSGAGFGGACVALCAAGKAAAAGARVTAAYNAQGGTALVCVPASGA
jgi:galactokinase